MRLILGEVRVPCAGTWPLGFAFALALGDDMVIVVCCWQLGLIFVWLGLKLDAYNRISMDLEQPLNIKSGEFQARFDIGASNIESG